MDNITFNLEKYRAIDTALTSLHRAGYTMDDDVYLALIRELAKLEKSKTK